MTQPFRLAFHDGYLYVGNTNSLVRYKYANGDTKAPALPRNSRICRASAITRHATCLQPGRQEALVSVGSSNNIDEQGSGTSGAR